MYTKFFSLFFLLMSFMHHHRNDDEQKQKHKKYTFSQVFRRPIRLLRIVTDELTRAVRKCTFSLHYASSVSRNEKFRSGSMWNMSFKDFICCASNWKDTCIYPHAQLYVIQPWDRRQMWNLRGILGTGYKMHNNNNAIQKWFCSRVKKNKRMMSKV